MNTKKTPQDIWDQYKAGHGLDTGHVVQDGKGEDRDFVHADGESWERKVGEADWKPVPHINDRP